MISSIIIICFILEKRDVPSQLRPIPPHWVVWCWRGMRSDTATFFLSFFKELFCGSADPFFVKLMERCCCITHMVVFLPPNCSCGSYLVWCHTAARFHSTSPPDMCSHRPTPAQFRAKSPLGGLSWMVHWLIKKKMKRRHKCIQVLSRNHKAWEVSWQWLALCFLRCSKCWRCRHTHIHTPFLHYNIHLVIAYLYATMSAGICVMNLAQAFKVSTLPLCQLGYLFNQHVTWMRAECDGGGGYRDYTLFFHVS